VGTDSELRDPDGEAGTDEAGGLARAMVLLEIARHGAETGELGVERMMAATTTLTARANSMGRVHVPTSSGAAASDTDDAVVTDEPSPEFESI